VYAYFAHEHCLNSVTQQGRCGDRNGIKSSEATELNRITGSITGLGCGYLHHFLITLRVV